MNFGKALKLLKKGRRVAREGWNGIGMCLGIGEFSAVKDNDGNAYTAGKFIVIKTADDVVIPWTASQTDLLEDDWYEYDLYEDDDCPCDFCTEFREKLAKDSPQTLI